MGNCSSGPARRYRLLIGDLEKEHFQQETKIYALSKYVLGTNDEFVGIFNADYGVCILDKYSIIGLAKDASLEIFTTEKDRMVLFYLLISDKSYFCSQTFTQWKSIRNFDQWWKPCCKEEKTKIYLQPVDDFPAFLTEFLIDMKHCDRTKDFFGLLQLFLEAYFDGMTVDLLPPINILNSKWKIKTRSHHKTGSKQYFVQDFFPALQKVRPSDGHCILGLTWTDLYPTEKLNFVLGEAHLTYKSGIFCFGRCEPKTYDSDTFKDIDDLDAKLLWRIIKVS